MFPRLRGGPGAGRGVVLALLAVAIGAAVLVAGDDGMSTGGTRLAVTGTTPAPPRIEIEPSSRAGPPASEAAPLTSASAPAGEPPPPAVPTATVATQAAAPAQTVVTAGAVATPVEAPTSVPPSTVAPVPATTSTVTTTPPTTTTAPPAGPARLASAEAGVVPLTNADRRAAGLGPLTRDACLDGVASRYAEQLARSGVLAHNPGAGAAIIGCRPGATWGDNVGTSEPCDTVLLEQKWMASPGHRRNILTGAFTLVGVGAWADAAGGCWIQVLFSS